MAVSRIVLLIVFLMVVYKVEALGKESSSQLLDTNKSVVDDSHFASHLCSYNLLVKSSLTFIFHSTKENVARNKMGTQSGTYGYSTADKALDGNTNPIMDAGSCVHPCMVRFRKCAVS